MFTRAKRQGLIVSTRSQSTAALDELIICCDWPALLRATPHRLRHELSMGVPRLALFWLHDEHDVSGTVTLLGWLSKYWPDVRRIAMGYQLPPSIEVAVRSAGAHLYLASAADVCGFVRASLPEWLRSNGRRAIQPTEAPLALSSPPGFRASIGVNLHYKEPP